MKKNVIALLLLVACLSIGSHIYGLDLTPIQQDLLKMKWMGQIMDKQMKKMKQEMLIAKQINQELKKQNKYLKTLLEKEKKIDG